MTAIATTGRTETLAIALQSKRPGVKIAGPIALVACW
jgi:hypothetical protein